LWNGHYACTCYHPLFVFNHFGDLERCGADGTARLQIVRGYLAWRRTLTF
jgi:hypothetical protein